MTQANNPPTGRVRRYPYTYPPGGGDIGPYIDVVLRGTGSNNNQKVSCKALLDTGANNTFVPSFLLKIIRAKPASRMRIVGIENQERYVWKYTIRLEFNDRNLCGPVLEWPREKQRVMIIGRDLMQKYCITFDAAGLIGPELHFYIQSP